MANAPSVWIVVLNWNGSSDTLACLQSLQRLQYPERRIVVVDNGSTDGSADLLRGARASTGFELIEAKRNLGYAGGNNLGIRHALDKGAEFILVLNNDTIVDPLLLDELVGSAGQHPEAGCFDRRAVGIMRPALRRLYPGLAIDRSAASAMHKALLCAATNFVLEWARKLHDPQEAAHRRGVLDYLFRRFGDCQPEVRALAVAWASAKNERGGGQSPQLREDELVCQF